MMIAVFGDAMTPQQRRAALDAMFKNMADLPAEVLAGAHRGRNFMRARFVDHDAMQRLRALQESRPGGTIVLSVHELLTGRLPFEAKELRAGGYDALYRTIRESDPPRRARG